MKYRIGYLVLVLVLACTCLSAAEELPAQFAAWGTRGPEYPAAPAGFTELPAEPHRREPPTPSSDDTARGFVLFQRQPFDPIYHDTVPAAFEFGASLKLVAAPGQYEALTLGLYGLENLSSITASVGDCRSKGGTI